MGQIGKLILSAGGILAAVGLCLIFLDKTGFKGLPGDIRYESRNFRFYFPVVTCVVISLVASLLIWLWQWINKG